MLRLLCAFLILFFLTPASAADNHALLASGGKGGWLNVTRPLTADDMQGRLVLLDFWTYGCINCQHIVPDLEYLEETFGDKLLVIGVHSAKFTGEQGNDRILAAAKRFGLQHPVINDSDFAVWKSFGVKAWPTLILLGPDGKEIERFVGEGHRMRIARAIETTLASTTATTDKRGWGIPGSTNPPTGLYYPSRISSHAGRLYIADTGNNRILATGPTGHVEIIGSGLRGLKNGDKLHIAEFNQPRGLAVIGKILYVADTGNHVIRRIDLVNDTIETVAGTGTQGNIRSGEKYPALTTPLASPWDIELLSDGKTLAIAMAGTHQIWAFDTKANTLSLLAGNGDEGIKDGPAAEATLAQPSGLAQINGILYFVDAESSALRELRAREVHTLIGTGLFDFGHVDGKHPQAMLQHPQGLSVDEKRILIADTYNDALRLYDRETGELTTVKLQGELNEPGDVLMIGPLAFIVDTNNHAIKQVDLTTGAVQPFTLHLSGL